MVRHATNALGEYHAYIHKVQVHGYECFGTFFTSPSLNTDRTVTENLLLLRQAPI